MLLSCCCVAVFERPNPFVWLVLGDANRFYPGLCCTGRALLGSKLMVPAIFALDEPICEVDD